MNEQMARQIENVAGWLERKCDPGYAARELRIIAAQMYALQFQQDPLIRSYRAPGCICEHPYDLTVPGPYHHRSCPLRG